MSKKDKIKNIDMDDLKALPDVLDGRHHVIPIVTGGDEVLEEVNVPEILPILTLRSSVLFPGAITPITVGREKSIRLVREVNERNGLLGAVLQRESEVEDPAPDDMYKVGTAARIIKILEMPNGNLTVILNGLEKIEVKEYVSTEPYFQASVTPLRDSSPDVKSLEFEALVDSIRDIALGIIAISPDMPKEAAFAIKNIDSKRGIINFICSNLELSDEDRQSLLESPGLLARARKLLEILVREQQLVDQLVLSFLRSEKLQTHIRYLLEKGAMYRVCNGNLLYHGCIPMEPDGSFTRVTMGDKTYFGKSLMDACDRLCRTAMYDRRMENTDLLWYLWCGPYSPLNGKDKIATFERTFLDDPEARTEQKNPYYDLWNSGETARTILTEFGVNFERGHIINGHVPVRKTKGDTPIKANGKFINIDGGLSKAYQPVTGICGYTLVYSSHELYLAEHQPFDPDTAARESADVLSRTIMIEQYPDRLRVRDTDGGADVERRIADLKKLLAAYRSGLVRTPSRME